MDGIVEVAVTAALLLATGGLIGLGDWRGFAPRWLLAAAGLVIGHDVLLTRAYRTLPLLLPELHRNWEGKLLALAGTLLVATLPGLGWRRSGLTLAQAPGSLRLALAVGGLYAAVLLAFALLLPNEGYTGEDLAFQLTLPGLEEESFYRGVLLLALDRAFAGRRRLLGVEWGWGAVLSCALFGLLHAFGYRHGAFHLDPATMALTALPSLVAVWLRYRTGSVSLPIVLHNWGNTIMLLA